MGPSVERVLPICSNATAWLVFIEKLTTDDLDWQVWENSVNPDQLMQNIAFLLFSPLWKRPQHLFCLISGHALHSTVVTEPFIIMLPLSWYDLNDVERDVKTPNHHHHHGTVDLWAVKFHWTKISLKLITKNGLITKNHWMDGDTV